MSVKTMIGKVLVKSGIFIDPRNPKADIRTLADANKIDADCGCGVDCCNKKLVLTDQVALTGASLYFSDGALKFALADGTTYTVTAVAD